MLIQFLVVSPSIYIRQPCHRHDHCLTMIHIAKMDNHIGHATYETLGKKLHINTQPNSPTLHIITSTEQITIICSLNQPNLTYLNDIITTF